MKRFWGILAAAALLLSGCGATASQVVPTVEVVQGESRVISVTASEEVRVEPDIAEISIGIRTEDNEAEVCRNENSLLTEAVVEAVKALGVEESSIQTSGLDLYPRYKWNGSEDVLNGYTMTTTLTVSDLPVELTGKVLTDAVGAGATDINSVTYLSSGYDEAYQQALELAIQTARTKADVMAEASGCAITSVANIQENNYNQTGRYTDYTANAAMMKADTAETVVQPGELSISAQVTVEFSIE